MKNLKTFGIGYGILATVLIALAVIFSELDVNQWLIISGGTLAAIFSMTQTKVAKSDIVLYVAFLIAIFLIKWL